MNWKDYFYFNRSERNGIIVFSILLLIIVLLPKVYQNYFHTETIIKPGNFQEEIIAYEKQLAKILENEKHAEALSKSYETERLYKATDTEIDLRPFRFDPNNMSKESWLKMGMPERIANTIKNFESAGGSFKFKEDLKRIYGIDDDMYATLEPYIDLSSTDNFKREAKSKDLTMIDLNTADKSELRSLNGIGPHFSKKIVEYRKKLGGYISVDQIMDIHGMGKERFEMIQEYMFIKDTTINKIPINKAGISEMVKHPYFNWNLANNIIQLRKQHGLFKEIEDIKKSHLIDKDTYNSIASYLTLD